MISRPSRLMRRPSSSFRSSARSRAIRSAIFPARAFSAEREELARTIAGEAGKPIKAAQTEVARAATTFKLAAEEACRIQGEVLPLDIVPDAVNRFAITRRFPVGPVVAITPFNFPLNLAAHKIAPAIAAGNTVIHKPASATPLTALLLGEILMVAGMPPGMLTSLLTTGLIIGIPFSLLAVWILGKTHADPADEQLPPRFQMPASEWAWKLAAAAVLYMIVYFTFGYYVAWRTPGLPSFYGGIDPGTYLGQLAINWQTVPWLYPFQFGRGLIWAGTGCIVLAMHKGRTWEAALATGLAFTVLMNAGMMLPNPFFTPVVQRAHTIELVSSNFVYGSLLGLLMTWKGRLEAVRMDRRAAAAR